MPWRRVCPLWARALSSRTPGAGIVQARVPLATLERVAALPGVRYVSSPRLAVADTGGTVTEGDAILGADRVRDLYGVDGKGIRVGVISDGIYGLSTAMLQGELPQTSFFHTGTKLTATTGGVTAVSYRADRDLEAGLGSGRGSEGVAMLEIIHDLAPAARLYFANFSTELEFDAAVDFMADNVDILVDDISFFGGPYDGESLVSAHAAAALEDPDRPLRAFFTSAGNRAQDHYEESYEASTVDGLASTGSPGRFHQFRRTSKTSDGLGLSASASNMIFLFHNQSATLVLTWDDPQGTSTNDYDMYLFRNATGQLVAAGAGAQTGTQDPVETIVFSNPGDPGLFELRVQNYRDEAAPRDLEIFVIERPFRTIFPNGGTLAFNTIEGSIPMMADAKGGVISVGAISASDPGQDDLEPYSSRGPTNDGRLKPEIASIDGVSVSGAGGFPTTFSGTSAAAPHAAGIAALLLQMAPCLAGQPSDVDAAGERKALHEAITTLAVDLGPPGPDQASGHGRDDAGAVAMAMLPTADPGPAGKTAECVSPAATPVTLDGSASRPSWPTCAIEAVWTGPFDPIEALKGEVTLPPGRHEARLEVSQNGVTRVAATQTIEVRDATPPRLRMATYDPVIWPPNHRMQAVNVPVLADDACDPSPRITLVSAASSEAEDAPGRDDGSTAPDIEAGLSGPGDPVVMLRAERDGRGPGRTYTLTVAAEDAAGNGATVSVPFFVPHDAGPGSGSVEPMMLRWPDAATITVDPVVGALRYEIVSGELAVPARSWESMVAASSVTCLAALPAGDTVDIAAAAGDPPPGVIRFYLGQYDAGLGFTGFGTAGAIAPDRSPRSVPAEPRRPFRRSAGRSRTRPQRRCCRRAPSAPPPAPASTR